MNAVRTAPAPRSSSLANHSVAGIGALRALLLGEAALGLVLAILLSMLASGMRDFVGGDAGRAAEQTLRFAAGFAFLFAILAAIASRGARRRRSWSWTLAALLQLLAAIGTGVAILTATWHPVYLVGFALPALVMVVLSTSSVRRALGQE
jgi:peptidoglycan/LPS O-acetylase OafA/YrhL